MLRFLWAGLQIRPTEDAPPHGSLFMFFNVGRRAVRASAALLFAIAVSCEAVRAGDSNNLEVVSGLPTAVGTNVVAAIRAETNVVSLKSEASHGRDGGAGLLLRKLARAGTGLFEERESGYLRLRQRDPADSSSRLTVDSRWLRKLGVEEPVLEGMPTIRTSIELDAEHGMREMRKVEFGLFDDVLWLMHEQREDEGNVTGVQLRGTW